VFVLVFVAWVNDTIFRTNPLRTVNKQMKTFSWIQMFSKALLGSLLYENDDNVKMNSFDIVLNEVKAKKVEMKKNFYNLCI